MNNQPINRKGTAVGDLPTDSTSLSPFALGTRLVFKWISWLFTVTVLIQVFLAGLATFWNPAQWASHSGFAIVLVIVPILMLITSFVAWLPVSLRLRCAGLIAMVLLIAVSANLPSSIGYLSALHPVIGFMLFWESMSIARKSHAFTEAK